jgi:epsilon-lactone hydrolase
MMLSETATAILTQLSATPHPPPYPEAGDRPGWKEAFAANEAQANVVFGPLWEAMGMACMAVQLGPLPAQKLTPNEAATDRAPLLYLHGGGYTFYSTQSTLLSAAQMAAASGRIVYSLDYPVAPQSTWQETTAKVVEALIAFAAMNEGATFGMFGESAGGGLILGSLLRAKDEGVSGPDALVLFSPWCDIGGTGVSYRLLEGKDPAFTYADHLAKCAAAYCPDGDFAHPYVSPVHGNFSGFAPTLIHGGTHELLHSDFVRLQNAMCRDGVDTEFMIVDGLTHCFPVFFHYTGVEEASTAYQAAQRHWDRHLGNGR